jgi:cytoskeleton protein RodZ
MNMSTKNIEQKLVGWSGEQLRAARLRMGLTTEQVERQLFFQPGYVDSIELGNFKHLPGPLFIKGYIRAYAKLLQLSPHPFIKEFQERIADTEPEVAKVPRAEFTSKAFANEAFPDTAFPKSLAWKEKPTRQSMGWRLWLLLAVVALLLLVMWWSQLMPIVNSWLLSYDLRLPSVSMPQIINLGGDVEVALQDAADTSASEVVPTNDFASLIATTASTEVVPSTTAQNESLATVPAEEMPAFVGMPTTQQSASAVSSIAALFPSETLTVEVKSLGDGRWQIGTPAEGVADQLQVKFNSATWLQITDAVGVSQPLKTYIANHELKITGVAPFILTTGDIKALNLRFNEQEVSL